MKIDYSCNSCNSWLKNNLRDLRVLRGSHPSCPSWIKNPRILFDKADGHCYNFQRTSADVAQLAEQLFRK